MAEPQDVIDGDVKNQSLTIDASLLKKHPATEDLYQQLIAYPSEVNRSNAPYMLVLILHTPNTDHQHHGHGCQPSVREGGA